MFTLGGKSSFYNRETLGFPLIADTLNPYYYNNGKIKCKNEPNKLNKAELVKNTTLTGDESIQNQMRRVVRKGKFLALTHIDLLWGNVSQGEIWTMKSGLNGKQNDNRRSFPNELLFKQAAWEIVIGALGSSKVRGAQSNSESIKNMCPTKTSGRNIIVMSFSHSMLLKMLLMKLFRTFSNFL